MEDVAQHHESAVIPQISEILKVVSSELNERVRAQAQERPWALVGMGLGAGFFLGTNAGARVAKRALDLGWRVAVGAALGRPIV